MHFVDKLEELIHCEGQQVGPGELEEAVLQKCPMVCEVGVVGLYHPEHGEVPTAFVVVREAYKETVTADDIRNAVAGAYVLCSGRSCREFYICRALEPVGTAYFYS